MAEGPEWDLCRCAHFRASHPDGRACTRTMPDVEDPETGWHLPEWRCTCPHFVARPNTATVRR